MVAGNDSLYKLMIISVLLLRIANSSNPTSLTRPSLGGPAIYDDVRLTSVSCVSHLSQLRKDNAPR